MLNVKSSAEKTKYYWESVPRFGDRLLSHLDRERQSATYGSFDREHWAWKFRDFPLGMLQTAVYPAALLWKLPLPNSPFHANARLEQWIYATVDATLARQHSNGSFDGFCPNEQEAGIGLGVMHGVTEALAVLGERVPAVLNRRANESLRRACRFAEGHNETHGFITNHQALFAVVYHTAAHRLREPRYLSRSEEIVAQILRNQSPDGWFAEYGGPDPGYETLGIFHLATYWLRTASAELLQALTRSIEFLSHCIHPDGSVGGAYGRRHTQLFFPGGLEILAGRIPQAGAIARFMRERLSLGNVVTPDVADIENLIPLAYNYLEACATADVYPMEKLPCESLQGQREFPHAGIVVRGTPHYYAVLNAKKGGVCRIFDRHSRQVRYEDAGYVVRRGKTVFGSQSTLSEENTVTVESQGVTCRADFTAVKQHVPTPGKFLLLRVANLTAFRIPALARWMRLFIIRSLMKPFARLPLRLTRTVRFHEHSVTFQDRLECQSPFAADELSLARSFTGIHMGSAKYFHRSELVAVETPTTDGALEALQKAGRAEVAFSVEWASENVSADEPARTLAGVGESRRGGGTA